MTRHHRRHVRPGLQTSPRRALDLLRTGIRAGVVDQQLIEDVLVRSLWTSRNAVRSALQILADEGLVSRQRRFGTNVIRRVALVPMEELMPPPADRTDQGRVSVQRVECRLVPTSPIVAHRLETSRDSVILTEQVTFIDEEPVALRTSYLVTDLPPDLVENRLNDIDSRHIPSATAFEEFFGVRLGSVESTVEAISGQPDTCQVLGIPATAPVLFRDSVHSDIGGTPRLLVHTHYRGDRVALSGITDVHEGEIRTTSGVMARQRRATRPAM